METNRVTHQKYQLSKTDAEYAEQLGCNPRTIRRARIAGAPLDDPRALSAWFASKHSAPAGVSQLGGAFADLQSLKVEKLRLETERLRILNAVEAGELIPIERVKREMTRLGRVYRSEFEQFAAEIPGWEGLPRAEMERRTHRRFTEMVASLQKDLAEAFR